MTVVALLDGNGILHKTFHVIRSGSDQTIAWRVLESSCNYVLKARATEAAMAMDGGDNFRYKIYPEYKSNRGGSGHSGPVHETDPRDMYSILPAVQRLFRLVGFPYYQESQYEADDVCAAGASYAEQCGKQAWIICRDKDAFQSVTDKISVFWPKVGLEPEHLFDPAEVRKRTGFEPRAFADFQILCGDKIDAIPGVVKPAVAKRIMEQFGSLSAYFSTKEGRKFFLANESALRRNLRLIRMEMKAWNPDSMSTSLQGLHDSQTAWNEFGRLPKSFYELQSFVKSSKRRTLF